MIFMLVTNLGRFSSYIPPKKAIKVIALVSFVFFASLPSVLGSMGVLGHFLPSTFLGNITAQLTLPGSIVVLVVSGSSGPLALLIIAIQTCFKRCIPHEIRRERRMVMIEEETEEEEETLLEPTSYLQTLPPDICHHMTKFMDAQSLAACRQLNYFSTEMEAEKQKEHDDWHQGLTPELKKLFSHPETLPTITPTHRDRKEISRLLKKAKAPICKMKDEQGNIVFIVRYNCEIRCEYEDTIESETENNFCLISKGVLGSIKITADRKTTEICHDRKVNSWLTTLFSGAPYIYESGNEKRTYTLWKSRVIVEDENVDIDEFIIRERRFLTQRSKEEALDDRIFWLRSMSLAAEKSFPRPEQLIMVDERASFSFIRDALFALKESSEGPGPALRMITKEGNKAFYCLINNEVVLIRENRARVKKEIFPRSVAAKRKVSNWEYVFIERKPDSTNYKGPLENYRFNL